MELYWSKIVDPSRSPCLNIVNWKRVRTPSFFSVTSCPAEKCIFQLSYPMGYGWWSCGKEKLSIPLEAHHKAQSSEIFLNFQAKKVKELYFLFFGQSCWNCRFKLQRSTAFEQRMTCPSAAKKSCGSHLFGVRPGEADRTALVQQLSKAITFMS